MLPDRPLPSWELFLAAARVPLGLTVADALDRETTVVATAVRRILPDADESHHDASVDIAEMLQALEAAAGLRATPSDPAGQIFVSLEGIETGIRNCSRTAPLETQVLTLSSGRPVIVPTGAEMLRVKAWLLATRNTMRDILDLIALSDALGTHPSVAALATMDALYPQGPSASVLQQILQQLASPAPSDSQATSPLANDDVGLAPAYRDWSAVTARASHFAGMVLAGLPSPSSM